MQFLANENFPNPSIKVLRENAHDVKSIAEEMPGISDEKVIDIAKLEQRIILTFDKDYGELIFKYGMSQPPSVIFFRYKGDRANFAGVFLLKIIADNSIVLDNNFTVIEQENVRQRKYK